MTEREPGREEEKSVSRLIRDVFVLYRDGALSEASEARVKEHLAACDRCAKYYKIMKKSCKNEEGAAHTAEHTGEEASGKAPLPTAERYEALARRLRRERRQQAFLRCALVTATLAGGMAVMYTALKRREKTV